MPLPRLDWSPRPPPPRAEQGFDDPEAADEVPPRWRSTTVIGVSCAVLLIVITVVDASITEQVAVFTVFLGLCPLLASSVLGPKATAWFAAAALLLALVSGRWNEGQGAQYWIRMIDVALVGALAVLVSAIRTRRESDLRATRRIATAAQNALLPVLPSKLGSIALATRYHSATRAAQIGGDFFDFVADRGRIRVILGDVSGKGVDAVSQAARVIRAFRQYGASETDLVDVARRIDEYVLPFWDWEYYATAVLVEISRGQELIVVSAGHPPPLHQTIDGISELPISPSVPLGLGPAQTSTSHTWQPADRLLLYTDGLIEARDANGSFLPRAAIDRALAQGSINDSLDALLHAVREHSGRFNDDLALLLMANEEPAVVPALSSVRAG